MSPVFLDTSGLIALTNTDDFWHSRAKVVWQELLRQKRKLVKTSLILIDVFGIDHHFEQAGFRLLIT